MTAFVAWLSLLAQATLASSLVSVEANDVLVAKRSAKLDAWYEALGPPSTGESFGHYLSRAAGLQQGVPYVFDAPAPGSETLEWELDRFECVSFIESSLAVARCGFAGERDRLCFERELERSRYRGGRLAGYGSRLHYFVDWIDDNALRGRLVDLTPKLGGKPETKDFFYLSTRVLPRSTLSERELEPIAVEVARTEARLSARPHLVIGREMAPRALGELEDGDVVAFVRERPGLLVHHAGFVTRVGGKTRLLHASSYHARVVITSSDVASYLLRRPERRGILVARPLAP